MASITGKLAEPFYNLDYSQQSLVTKKLIRSVYFQASIKGLPVNDIIDTHLIHVVRNLSKYKRACMYNFKFIKVGTNGRLIITQQFINLILRLNDSLNYTEVGGWKDKTIDIDTICTESENIMNTKYSIMDEVIQQREKAICDIDYTEIINMTNNTAFIDIGQIDNILTRVGDFTNSLYMVTRLNAKYERSLYDATRSKCAHRLNLRTREFKPWKLYSCRPVYPDCMLPMSYYDYPQRSEFDATFIMPEDMGRIITEFVGYEFISNIRNDLIVITKGKNVIRNALGKWNKNELLNFAHSVPYNYINKTTQETPYTFIWKPYFSKGYIIDVLMTNFDNKELYYPFYRDVMILTNIVLNQRVVVRKRKKEEAITRWRKAHAEKAHAEKAHAEKVPR